MTASRRVRPSAPGRAVVLAAMAAMVTLLVALALPGSALAALSWSGPIARDLGVTGPALTAVACPSVSACTGLTVSGGEVAFNPAAPVPVSPTAVDPSVPLAVSCPSSTLCVAVDGAGNEVSYNPAAPAAPSVRPIDAGGVLDGVTCGSASMCVAVDTAGHAVTFRPTGAASPAVYAVDPGQFITGVSCPSATECVVIDTADNEVTFDPASGQRSSAETLQDYSGTASALTALACPSATTCEAFNGNGFEIQFDPQGSGVTIIPLDKGHAIQLATCPTSSQCTVLDAAGNELSFQPGSTTPPPGTPNAEPNTPAKPVLVAPAGDAAGVTCASSAQCVVVTGHGQAIRFDPITQAVAGPVVIDPGMGNYSTVACASAEQCTGADLQGDVLTFNPRSGAAQAPAAVQSSPVTVYGEACPAATQCTLVDDTGNEVTFNPQSPAQASAKRLVSNHPLLAIACPASTQCTALTDDRDEITFNPQVPAAATYASLDTPAGDGLTGVACPSATQCTAVDGTGDAVTFNPRTPGHPTPHPVLAAAAVAVACPTTAECVAVDARGDRSTFAPASPADATTATIDASQPEALQCITATYCVALDAAGNAVEFDPHGTGATGHVAFAPGATGTGLACDPSDRCVAVDQAGVAFVGTGRLPARPADTGRPSITGRDRETARLTARPGAWSNRPTGFVAHWQRCTAAGARCRAIPGATAQTYHPVAADVGHRLRVSEIASNQAGFAVAAAVSRVTARIAAVPRPPTISQPALSVTRSGRGTLRFALAAARFGPELRGLTVSLPKGLTIVLRRAHREVVLTGLTLRERGRKVTPAAARTSRGRLSIILRRTAGQLQVTLAAPALAVSHSLVTRLRRRAKVQMALTVRLTGRGSGGLHATRHWTAR